MSGAVATLLLGGCASAPTPVRQPVGSDGLRLTGPARVEVQQESLATRIDEIGRQRFAAIYGGLSTPDDGRTLLFHVTRPDARFSAAVRTGSGGVAVRFTRTRSTLADLADVQRAIESRAAQWERRGIDIRGYGDDIVAVRENIYVVDLTARKREVIERVLPHASIELINETKAEAGSAHLL